MTSGSPRANPSSKPTIYPRYCHHVSPTLPQWCPLRAADMHMLKDVGVVLLDDAQRGSRMYRLFHHGNHPIKWVKVVGVVVAVDEFPGRKIYTIDDSSGACVECVCVAPNVTPMGGVHKPAHLEQGGKRVQSEANTDIKGKGKAADAGDKGKAGESVDNPTVPWDLIDVGAVVKVKGRVGNFRDMMQVEVVSVFVVKTTDGEVRFWNEAGNFKRDVLGNEWVVSKEMEEKLRRRDEKRSKKKSKGDSLQATRAGKHKAGRKPQGHHGDEDKDPAKRVLEGERRGKAGDEEDRQRREIRLQEERRKRKGLEDAKNWSPSLAVMKAAAGKYDLLGI